MLLASCPYLAGCHPHRGAFETGHMIHGGKATGYGVIAAIFLFLLVRGLLTGKWG